MRRLVSANASFATEPSGPGVPALRLAAGRRVGGRRAFAIGGRPRVREPQDFGVDPQTGEPVAPHPIVTLRVLAPDLQRVADRSRVAAGDRATDRDALVHQGGERDAPPVAEAPDA